MWQKNNIWAFIFGSRIGHIWAPHHCPRAPTLPTTYRVAISRFVFFFGHFFPVVLRTVPPRHVTANEVVVVSALNARCVTRTSGSDAGTARIHSGDAADGSRLCFAPLQRLCDNSKLSNCTVPHTQKWVCGTTRLRRREGTVTWQSPISPQMFLQTGLGRASTSQLGQPPVGGDLVLPRYSRRPHRPTPISLNFSARFSKIQEYHTQKN